MKRRWLAIIGNHPLQITPERKNGLGMDLANSGLGKPKDLGNLAQTKVFKVVERQHLPLHLGQSG